VVGAQAGATNAFFSLPLPPKLAAYLITEALQKTTAEAQPNERIFKLYSEILSRLSKGTDPALVTCFGLLHLLRLEGIEPALPPTPLQSYFFNLDEGAVEGQSREQSIALSPKIVKLWKVLLEYDTQTAMRIKTEKNLLQESIRPLCSYIEYHFHARLKSQQVFQETI
jgi:DNA repair protein RecO